MPAEPWRVVKIPDAESSRFFFYSISATTRSLFHSSSSTSSSFFFFFIISETLSADFSLCLFLSSFSIGASFIGFSRKLTTARHTSCSGPRVIENHRIVVVECTAGARSCSREYGAGREKFSTEVLCHAPRRSSFVNEVRRGMSSLSLSLYPFSAINIYSTVRALSCRPGAPMIYLRSGGCRAGRCIATPSQFD